jgi:hypothetical protein
MIARFLLDIAAALAITATVVIVIEGRENERERAQAISGTRDAVRMLQAEVAVQAALSSPAGDRRVFPRSINPAWFRVETPRNHLLNEHHPWVEVASPYELDLDDPLDLTVDGGQHAMFWYNPARGVIRARVPRTLTDADARGLYDAVNVD